MNVKRVDDGISITPLNERPIKIDFGIARKIAEMVDSKAGAKADAVNDDDDKDSDHDPASIVLIDFGDIQIFNRLCFKTSHFIQLKKLIISIVFN